MTNTLEITREDNCSLRYMKIGEAIFDASNRTITRGEKTIDVEPKVAELLSLLCSARGTHSRDSILSSLWGLSGSDEALTQTVSKLRRALGDVKRPYSIIKTVPTVGYKLAVNPTLVTGAPTFQSGNDDANLVQSIQRIFTKNSVLIKGAVIGASLTLLAVGGYTALNNPKDIETEIECPADWTSQDCIALVSASRP